MVFLDNGKPSPSQLQNHGAVIAFSQCPLRLPQKHVEKRAHTLQHLFESLRNRYSTGEVIDELLVELAVTDYWRLQKGLEYELKYLTPGGGEFHPQGGMPTLVRYMTANRRAFDKSLQLLRQVQVHEDAKAKTVDGDSDSHETDSSGVPHDGGPRLNLAGNAPQKPAEASGLEEVAEDENGIPRVPATVVDGDVSDGEGKAAA